MGNIGDWTYEPPDYSVNIMESWTHEVCPKEYEQGAEILSDRIGPEVRGYANFKYTLVCLDCGEQFSFEQPEFVGFDEDEVPNYDE